MKKSIYRLSLLLGLFLAGCAHEPADDEQTDLVAPKIFTCYIEQEAVTKTVMGDLENGVNYVRWSPDDVIRIGGVRCQVDEISNDGTIATFRALDNADPAKEVYGSIAYDATRTYGSTSSGNMYWAMYPATLVDANRDIILPEKQVYTENRIDNLPMYAIAFENEPFVFRALCSVLAVTLTGGNDKRVGEIEVKSNNQYLSGKILFWSGLTHSPTNPRFTLYTSNNNSQRTVRLDCKENTGGAGVALDPDAEKTFYIAIPPQKYTSAVTVTVKAPDGSTLKSFTSTNNNVTTVRRHIYTVSGTID